MEVGSDWDTQKDDQLKLCNIWVAPIHKVLLVSPWEGGGIYQIFSGPVLWRDIWFVHLQPNTQEAQRQSFITLQLFTQPVILTGSR